jgi:hypothetical protein
MRAYAIAIAAFLASAVPAVAEPAKDEAPKVAQPLQQQHAPIVFASADALSAPTVQSPQPAPAAAKRRVAPRVTTCRCGDPQVSADNPEQ